MVDDIPFSDWPLGFDSSLGNHIHTTLPNPVFIIGDFNLPDIHWPTLTGATSISNNFCECIFESNFTQLVESPTHIHGNILDVLTNSPENVYQLTVHPPEYQCVTLDHYLISFIINFRYSTHPPSSKGFYNYSKGDYWGLTAYLLNCDFTTLHNSSDAEEIWYILKSNILSGIEPFILKVKLHTRQFPNWFTPQLRHSHKCLRTLQRKFNKYPTSNNFHKLTKAQDSFQTASLAAKSTYEQTLIFNFARNKDSKLFWFIKEFTKSHILPPQLHDDSSTADTNLGKAKLFNHYFHSVFTQSSLTHPTYQSLTTT